MSSVPKMLRACITGAVRAAKGLATAVGSRARDACASVHDAAGADAGATTHRVDKVALAAMYLHARFPVLAQQYIAVLEAGGKISGPLRTELAALSYLANTFGFSLGVGRVLLIGKDANGGVIGPAV